VALPRTSCSRGAAWWRKAVLTAAGSGEEVVPASDYRALQSQVRELHRLLGKKTLETEILKEAT
jgi:transposase